MSKQYDGIFAKHYDYLMQDVDYQAWAERIVKQLKTHHPRAKILVDLACGTGNITGQLARKGYMVTGIDLSEAMLMVAQDKAYEKNLRVQYLRQDMLRFGVHRKVEAITCICDGLNYLTSEVQLAEFFENAYKQLSDSGIMILDISTPYKYANVLSKRTIAELDDHVSFIWENHFDAKEEILEFDIAFFVPEGEEGLYRRHMEHHVQKSHSLETLQSHWDPYFDLVELSDGEHGSAVTETSERWMIVLRRKS